MTTVLAGDIANALSLDPYLPPPERCEWFYQQQGDKETWKECGTSALARKLASDAPPMFRSALGFTQPYDQQKSNQYHGPAYFDFDCGEGQTVADVIPPVKEFLTNLRGKGVDLDSLRIFATGGKGFHVEMPLHLWLPEIPAGGVRDMPYLLKEIANELYCDTMDMRVYTKRRMWRTPNILRPNGKYKVPVTAAEVFEMSAESYAEICSAPRQFPPLAAPEFNPTLGAIFTSAQRYAEAATKHRAAASPKLTAAMRGKLPPSVAALCKGELQSGAGWNRIAMQLALLAHALGWDADRLIAECGALIYSHTSDGRRYRTKRDREAELLAQFDYAAGSGYQFSIPALRSILPPGRYADLTLLGRIK